ncbi:YdeI/OmpD-associated family protein [Lysinibacillus sphaericus]|uniref:YdeI/OmpD-associated family protein n=1 Tax=Lysinibacillus sphaericus TaxID=1421 RepID=UPI003D036C4C
MARGKKKTANSQCVSDYERMVPQLREKLVDNAQDVVFYDGLTPGYQKDWARYIYSAKMEETAGSSFRGNAGHNKTRL